VALTVKNDGVAIRVDVTNVCCFCDFDFHGVFFHKVSGSAKLRGFQDSNRVCAVSNGPEESARFGFGHTTHNRRASIGHFKGADCNPLLMLLGDGEVFVFHKVFLADKRAGVFLKKFYHPPDPTATPRGRLVLLAPLHTLAAGVVPRIVAENAEYALPRLGELQSLSGWCWAHAWCALRIPKWFRTAPSSGCIYN
jgi:hypothetical protein